jgi:DNA repair protein RecN (Recombination protein N)
MNFVDMLKSLYVQNYAIIEELTVAFSNHLNIITGETGAGKSIVMGALSLILGERADTTVLLSREKKCYVEGTFLIHGKVEVHEFLKENDLDVEDELVIRREIAANGKSRAFINDTPVNLSQLQQLSSSLVDLHQQFNTLQLGETEFQRRVVDALAGNNTALRSYISIYQQLQSSKKHLAELEEEKRRFNKEADYTTFLFEELNEAGFKENELEDIESELKLLSNSEAIKEALSKASFVLEESETPVIQQLKTMLNQLQGFANHHPDLQSIIERLQSVQIELKDIAGEIERLNEHVNYDPKRIDVLNEKMSLGYRLLKKHGVKTTNELLGIKAQLQSKLQAVLNIDESIAEKEKETQELSQQAEAASMKISLARQKQIKPLEDKVNALLTQVGMPNARLKVEIKQTALHLFGMDEITFLFDANKSRQFAPISKVASGGELSRLMLCIKSLVASTIDLPTMIFDEIDTGISGEAARQVGAILKELAEKRQIICITHQPQIAGKANMHFYVYKEIIGDAVKTNVRRLSEDERITTIAKMLSGEKPTAAAIENAREMIMN